MVPALAGLLPIAVAAAWVPVRSDLPNTDVALLLVLSVGAVAMIGGRWAVLVGSVASATAFDFFDAPPYGQLFMTRGRDVVTTVVLVGAGLVVGGLVSRLRTYRVMAAHRGADFTVMSGAARLMAFGHDAPLVVGALAGELVSRLGLKDCEFHYGAPLGDHPCIARDGTLVAVDGCPPEAAITEIDLPVWAGTEVVGRYHMSLKAEGPPTADRLIAAVGIAEQAGAALAGRPPDDTPAPGRARRLRLVR
jgi:hypothetical protein